MEYSLRSVPQWRKEKPRNIKYRYDPFLRSRYEKSIRLIPELLGSVPLLTPYPLHQAISRPRSLPFRRTWCRFRFRIHIQRCASDVAGSSGRLRSRFRVFRCLAYLQIFSRTMLGRSCRDRGEDFRRRDLAFLCVGRKLRLRLRSWRRVLNVNKLA